MNTCGGCYLDKQITDYRKEKLHAARESAKMMVKETGQTVVIYKVFSEYKIISAVNSEGLEIIEFISKYQ